MSFISNYGRSAIWGQTLNVETDSLKLMLLAGGWTPDPNDRFVADIVAHELGGIGYTGGFGGSGRKVVNGRSLEIDPDLNSVWLQCDAITWPSIATANARFAAVIHEETSDADSLIVAIIDLNPDAGVTFDGSDWVFTPSADGLLADRIAA